MRRMVRVGVLGALGFFLRAQTPPQFAITDLGTLPGFAVSEATAISSNGIVTGYSANTAFNITVQPKGGVGLAGSAQGWVYSNGTLTRLAPFGTGTSSNIPLGVNRSGQVIGINADASMYAGYLTGSGFFYLNGQYNTPANLNGLAPMYGSVQPVAISDAGAVAVSSTTETLVGVYSNLGPYPIAGIWNNSEIVLPLPAACAALAVGMSFRVPDLCFSQATAISPDGNWTAGFLEDNSLYEPALWNGHNTPITTGAAGVAVAVNNAGQAVGTDANGAILLSSTGTTTSLGGKWYPASINNSGWIVGATGAYQVPGSVSPILQLAAISKGGSHAILSTLAGKQFDLLAQVNNSAGWELDYAYAINDANQIVGTGFHNGVQTAFLLTPVTPPSIAGVVNAESGAAAIAPNTWVEIDGSNFGSTVRPWQGSDFVNNQLPIALSGVSVSMNGEKAFVYYISSTQIDVLTPPDLAPGPVQVVVSSNGLASAPATVQAQAVSPSFFVNGGGHYVIALHADGTLIGPPTLYPGLSTPAQRGETILLFANGFGAVSPAVVSGSEQQSGSLPTLPQLTIGGTAAQVQFAGLISPGLYQFNVVVPDSASSGDSPLVANYSGSSTQTGVLLTVQ